MTINRYYRQDCCNLLSHIKDEFCGQRLAQKLFLPKGQEWNERSRAQNATSLNCSFAPYLIVASGMCWNQTNASHVEGMTEKNYAFTEVSRFLRYVSGDL